MKIKTVPILMFFCVQEPEEGAGAGHHAPLRGHGLLPLQLPGSGGEYSGGEISFKYLCFILQLYLRYSEK